MKSMLQALATMLLLDFAVADIPILDVMKAVSKGGDAPYISYWCPGLVHTRANKTLLFAQADTAAARARKGAFGYRMAVSHR